MFRYLALLALASVAVAQTHVLTCGAIFDERYLPIAVRSPGCIDGQCFISRTAPVQFEVDATVPYDTNSLMVTGAMYYKIPDMLEVVIPIPLPEEIMDGCQGLLQGSCPFSSGQQFTWAINEEWGAPDDMEEGTTFELEFRFYDENEIVASCFRVPVIITA